MSEAFAIGLIAVILGGVFQGSFLLPSKWMRGWEWENYWAIFAVSAYLICPWIVALATVPDLLNVYRGAPSRAIVQTVLFGFGWALGAVLFGLGAEALGMALGFAIILGVAATSGTLIPLIRNETADFWAGPQGITTIVSMATMLLGVVVCSFAGRWKEQQEAGTKKGSYRTGVLICVASGLLAACGGLGFAFGKPVYEPAISETTPIYIATFALLPILMSPMFLVNSGYASWLMVKNKTAGCYRHARWPVNLFLALFMGVLWLIGMALYGSGSGQMGPLGTSLGWSIVLSAMIIVANALGVVTGEWDGAPSRSRWQLSLGLAILLAAIGGLGYANSLGTSSSPDGSSDQLAVSETSGNALAE